jgi:hypothetical protein
LTPVLRIRARRGPASILLKTRARMSHSMRIHEAFPSTFFCAADIEEPLQLTIKSVSNEVLRDGTEKRTLSFVESDKRLAMNKTNFALCAEATGQDDDENWIGKKITLVRERVTFRGDRVDAVRIAPAEIPY